MYNIQFLISTRAVYRAFIVNDNTQQYIVLDPDSKAKRAFVWINIELLDKKYIACRMFLKNVYKES